MSANDPKRTLVFLCNVSDFRTPTPVFNADVVVSLI